MDSDRLQKLTTKLANSVPNIDGALLASPDGHPLASALANHDPRSTAAIIASSRGLGDRLAELAGTGQLEEIVVRSTSGYVVIYSSADGGALTVLGRPSVNLALLHLKAREVIGSLAEVSA